MYSWEMLTLCRGLEDEPTCDLARSKVVYGCRATRTSRYLQLAGLDLTHLPEECPQSRAEND
jgi:hypothetical protein